MNLHSDFRLAVDGKIVSKEVIVTQLNWADYVFANNYKLKSLKEVEAYTKTNNHLPNIPSASEIEASGLDVAEMSKLQMEKLKN